MSAHKRPRLEYAQNGEDIAWRHVASEELALEILIRQRLAETIQGRIAWALYLQESLNAQHDNPPEPSGRNEFKIVAEDALDAIEAPVDFLIHHEPEYPALPLPQSLPLPARDTPGPSTRPTRTSARDRSSAQPAKLLFVSYPDTSSPFKDPTLATLACVDCARSDFPSLQGLLNHARLKHGRSYGSHDECIASCAVPVRDPVRRAWVRVNGVEVPAGDAARPSLRRLFERAVGDVGAKEMLDATPAEGKKSPSAEVGQAEELTPIQNAWQPDQETASDRARHLALTLGLHKDSAGLAQFLGREQKRRCINVYDEDEDVVIGDLRSAQGTAQRSTVVPHKKWRPHRRNHNQPSKEGAENEEGNPPPLDHPLEHDPAQATPATMHHDDPTSHSASRFHIGVRIAISDRSLYIPKDTRPHGYPEHTHQWQLSVASPSYSRPLTTFLSSLTITSLADPPPPALYTPLSVKGPPFYVRGMASEPFLAKLTFHWAPSSAGEGANPPLDVVHWIELDLHKRTVPVLGEEQLVDVELDRNTLFAEAWPNNIPTTNWDDGAGTETAPSGNKKERRGASRKAAEEVPAYVRRLRSLLLKAPVTMKDVTTRHPPRVPYHLAPTPAAFRKLVPGRRKAIEFAVARSLCDAYHYDLPADCALILLTVADVYCWLEDECHFPRPPQPKVIAAPSLATQPGASQISVVTPVRAFCPLCGDEPHERALVKHEADVKEEPDVAHACPIYPNGTDARLPVLDAGKLVRARHAAINPDAVFCAPYGLPKAFFLPRVLTATPVLDKALWTHVSVSAADPRLTLAVRALVDRLGLSAFHTAEAARADNRFPLETLGASPLAVTQTLAPHALLALLLRPVVCRLVNGAVSALRIQRPSEPATGPPRKRARQKGSGIVLTPLHVMLGLNNAPTEGGAGSAMFVGLGRLGIDAKMKDVKMAPISSDWEAGGLKVTMEESY